MKKTRLLTLISFLLVLGFAKAQEVDIFSVDGGEISARHGNSNVSKLIDNKIDTNYDFDGLPNSIIFKAPNPYTVSKVALTSSSLDATRDPKNMEISGSFDGLHWEVIRNINNYSFTERKQTKSITISGIQPYTYFRLRITAVNSETEKKGALAEWRLFGEQKSLPQVPTDARANPLNASQIKLSWRDQANDEENYLVQRSVNGSTYKTIATLPANTTSYIDDQVVAGAPYTYRVCAQKERMNTGYAYSNTIEAPMPQTLTSLTASYPYLATDQRNNSPVAEGIACAFDGDVSTKYLTSANSTWLQLKFEQAFKVTQYSITSANDSPGRDPKNWALQGSNDGSNWETLETRLNEVFDFRFQKRVFEIDNNVAYNYYRLTIGKNNGDSNTQLADWLLYADVPAGTTYTAPQTPANFVVEPREYHHVKLSWTDVANETSYLIERSEDGGTTFDFTYEIPANNTESYPYSLKPETDYVFKLYAVNGDKKSAPAIVNTTTPERKFVEKWENYDLWILDEPATFTKVKEIKNTAFYIIDGYTVSDVNDLYYQFYADNWEYVFECYGEELSDSRLHVLLIPMEEGGGLASIHDYRSGGGNYTNMVYIKANKNWFKNRSESGYIYDVMAHEICHIIEGVGGGYNGSMFYPVWGDSKWAEILQYDIFKALGSPRAQSWHNEYMNGAGGADYPDKERNSYWYRDFFYPTYDAYGKTDVLKKFWKLQKEHYRMKNGSFVGSAENPGGRGNLGEFIHFWSGACGVDVKPYAMEAFGWNEQYEMWLQRAKTDYPGITYVEAPIDNSSKNICQNGGAIKSNISTLTAKELQYLIDNNYLSYCIAQKTNELSKFVVNYSSSVPVKVDKYLIAVRDDIVPASWVFYGSTDEKNWVELDRQDAPDFAGNSNKITATFDNKSIYKYFKFEFLFSEKNQIKLTEIELWGIEYISAPTGLRARKLTEESVYLDWSAGLDEVKNYEVERSVDGVNFTKISDVDRYEISYTDELPAAGAYYYRIATVNKNSEKEKAYSNIQYINSLSDGLDDLSVADDSFYDIINNLNNYPANRVSIYLMTGSKVFDRSYKTNDLFDYINLNFNKGVYIINVQTGEPGMAPVAGKIIVR